MARTKVQSELIATNAISGTIIADGAITSTHLAANCVDSSELVTGSIDTIHIAANQVTATKIVTNGVLTRHISDDQVTAAKLANSINTDIATGVTANTTANAALPKAGGTLTGALVVTADANPALEISRGSANTTNVNLKYNTTLTGQLSAANAEFQISAAGSSTPMEFFTNGSERMRIRETGAIEITGSSTTSQAQAFITNDNSVLTIGSSVSGSVVKDIAFNSPSTMMYIDGSSGNVGIGTTSPAFENGNGLEIRNSSGNGAHLKLTDAASGTGGTQGFDLYMFNSQGYIENYENAPTIFRNNGNETMRINAAGGLSINDNIENPLSLNRTTTTTGASYIRFTNAGGNYYIGADSSAGDRMAIGGQGYGFTMTAESGRPIVFATSNTARMTINSSGNVGIGVTPKTDWHTGYDAIQIGQSSAFFANAAADEIFMAQNARYTSSGWKYNSSGTATLFDMQSGNTRWRRAASGSDDGTISWSDSMFIDTSGNVGIGTTSIQNLLQVAGAIGLDHAAMRSAGTTGDFSITVGGLPTLSSNAWKDNGMLVFYTGVDGSLANSNMFLSMIRVRGLSTYASAVVSNIVGTATISDSSASSTGLTINFDVGNSNSGSVFVILLGGGSNRPTISISG